MPVIGTFRHPITVKYQELGGPNAPLNPPAVTLGNATTAINVAPDGVGSYQHFERGSIYWDGRAGAAHLIYGQIRDRWGQFLWEQGRLGYPTSDEQSGPQGPPQRMNTFEYGAILWDPENGAQEQVPVPVPLFASIAQSLSQWLGIDFGFAVSADSPSPGRFQHFQLFKENLSRVFNSIEMHLDGRVYLSYTPVKHPLWYDTYTAVDDNTLPPIETATGLQPLPQIRQANVNPATWDVEARAFRGGNGPAPRWLRIDPPDYTVPHATPTLYDSGSYCDRDTFHIWGGPPEWETILPENDAEHDNGQRLVLPDQPTSAPGNHFVSSEELYEIMQRDSIGGLNILAYRGHPDGGDHSDRPIPWTSSVVEGVITNSFLSGQDYGGSHQWPPIGYWEGTPAPLYNNADGEYPDQGPVGAIVQTAANDWDIFIRPDPDYLFLLSTRGPYASRSEGNFNNEHQGNLECEGEQWIIPTGYRTEIGDRVHLTGRWVIDCGHPDWHAEFHPFELVVASHTQPSQEPGAAGGIETLAAVTISGAWAGGVVEFDVWPPPRPNGLADLHWDVNVDHVQNISVVETAAPEAPEWQGPSEVSNHIHFVATSDQARGTLYTGGDNDVTYNIFRRLAAVVRVWWIPLDVPQPDPSA